MKTICELFHKQMITGPNRVLIHHMARDTTYAQTDRQANAIAGWLEANGIAPGDRVALVLPNSADYVAWYLGILRAQAIVVALNPDTTSAEIAATVNHSGTSVVVIGSRTAATLNDAAGSIGCIRRVVTAGEEASVSFPASWNPTSLAEVLAEDRAGSRPMPDLGDVAQIIYTSGTTGRPKGVTLTHRNISSNCQSILAYLNLTAEDSIFVILPFFYSYGNSLLFTHLAAGGRLVLASDFVFWNRVLDLMIEQKVTGFSGVPSSYAMLLHKSDFRKRSFPDLRYMTCAGGGLAPAVVQRLQAVLPNVRLFPMYGQTEATARLSTLMPDEIESKLGSIGRGIPGVTLRVLDERGRPVRPDVEGEIVASGDNIMLGYWNDPEESQRVLRPDGLHTGDLARIDNDGYIFIVGRKSDIIKSGAYRLNPKEIEEIIIALEGVAEVAVAGLPDEIWGELPVAFVVRSPNAEIREADILDHCRANLPRYKMIREVVFMEKLPKTSSGKVRRFALRAPSAEHQPENACLNGPATCQPN
jgi:acyl-CoA synthetase (AMP-forming)/AMP-acid ligase II